MPPPVELQALPVNPVRPAVGAMEGAAATNTDPQQGRRTRREPEPAREVHKENIQVDEKVLSLGFSVDHSNNMIKIRVTNQRSGELVREFELKGLGQAHFEPTGFKGVMVDDRS